MIVEAALTVGVGLTVLLFAIQVGILGFLQTTADAAAYVDAHGNAVGTLDSLGPEHATHAIFPQVLQSDITGSPAPPPPITLPVIYGYGVNGTRHGGASMIQPKLFTTTVKPHATISYMGRLLGVSAAVTEPQYRECGVHFNVGNSAAQCDTAGTASSASVDYFARGENTPPYYVGYNFMQQCNSPQPWTSCTSSGSVNSNYLALGVGEFLDKENWAAPNAGASGTGNSSASQFQSTFQLAACHQRVYSALSAFFQSYSDLPSISAQFKNQINRAQQNGLSDYRYLVEFNTQTGGPASATDLLIQNVYLWDAQVTNGTTTNTVEPSGFLPAYMSC